MKKLIILLMMLPVLSNAQKYATKTGKISFYSYAPLENIQAANNQVNAAIEISNGDIVFKVLMKSFEFEKSLMQEHFNENYVESDVYPNATFTGKITDASNLDFAKTGEQTVNVEGNITIKDVTKNIKTTGTVEIKDGNILANSKFSIFLPDYNVKIPELVAGNISKTIDITVAVTLVKVN